MNHTCKSSADSQQEPNQVLCATHLAVLNAPQGSGSEQGKWPALRAAPSATCPVTLPLCGTNMLPCVTPSAAAAEHCSQQVLPSDSAVSAPWLMAV